MRASMLAFAGILVCSASAASAQAVIDVEGSTRRPAAGAGSAGSATAAPGRAPSRAAADAEGRESGPAEDDTAAPPATAAGSRSTASTTDSCGSTPKTARSPIAARSGRLGVPGRAGKSVRAGRRCRTPAIGHTALDPAIDDGPEDPEIGHRASAGRNRRAEAGGRGAERASTAATAGRSDVAGQSVQTSPSSCPRRTMLRAHARSSRRHGTVWSR